MAGRNWSRCGCPPASARRADGERLDQARSPAVVVIRKYMKHGTWKGVIKMLVEAAATGPATSQLGLGETGRRMTTTARAM
jgi:hypothetical protein